MIVPALSLSHTPLTLPRPPFLLPCAEFSGFLLYKELGRRMATSNPVVAEIFTLLARDEARHAGFINKALSGAPRCAACCVCAACWVCLGARRRLGAGRELGFVRPRAAGCGPLLRITLDPVPHPPHSHPPAPHPPPSPPADFNLALDLGFLTKNRTYTFFQPKFIIYATYLSEKIGYWRYISIYRHLQRNPDNQLYPMFEYFENWCQDENRHGDFLTAMLKARPELLNGLEARLWSRFFCLSVYITMYLNDHARSAFYEALGLNTTQFNRHVILETNNATARVFPEVRAPASVGCPTDCWSVGRA